jgi:FtsZ-binding cell division protein ZapB
MKTMKLLDKLNDLIARPPAETPLKKLRKTVRALKEKQAELEESLKQTKGHHSRERLEQKIQVIKAQRRKGAERYRALKAEAKG